jgi:hypothetical protein
LSQLDCAWRDAFQHATGEHLRSVSAVAALKPGLTQGINIRGDVMRRIASAFAFAIALASLNPLSAAACGDKLLALGTGVRFMQQVAAHPGKLLIYARPGAASSPTLLDPKFQSALTEVGHKVSVVTTAKDLNRALSTGHFDLLLVDQADAQALSETLRSYSSPPFLLPMVCNGTKAEASEAAREFGCALRAPERTGRYLSTVDRAMKMKLSRDHVGSGR